MIHNDSRFHVKKSKDEILTYKLLSNPFVERQSVIVGRNSSFNHMYKKNIFAQFEHFEFESLCF